MNKKEKSMGINALLYASRTFLSIVFPLITYPYAARILEVDNIGKVQYSASIISYFLLAAELGITTYAMREGAKYRNERSQLEQFSSEVFSIGVCASVLSTIGLAICIIYLPALLAFYNPRNIYSGKLFSN